MYLFKYQIVVLLGIIDRFRACPAKVVLPTTTQAPEVETPQEDLDSEERNIPKDIDDLTKLLEAVVGESNLEYFDPRFDTVDLLNSSEVATLDQKGASLVDGRSKRQIGPLIASLIPQLSKFGGGLLKSILSHSYRGVAHLTSKTY